MQPQPLLELCQALSGEFRRDPKGARVASLLAEYSKAQSDWRGWSFFAPDCYTRNQVHHEPEFELLLLCWGAQQKSPIHNHEGQRCWMSVLEGEVVETLFEVPSNGAPPRAKGTPRRLSQGQVAFITDEIALHEIASGGGRPAVSLHLYSRPFSTCQVYDPTSGQVQVRQLGYYSVRGERGALSRASRP
ncbi:MAG: cysteine dioxygenase family protein [Planctomycetes bacterium]|nr:cysteine dioxygenase family protein [Planctomycetota bacterium]